jgi:transcriptional regulator with XRE-family HTH domain
MVRIGRRVERLRTQQGFSQRELAKRARVTQPYLSQLEQGQRSNPSVAVLTRVARALGVPVAALLE